MSEHFNTTCSICGKPYYKCMSCKSEMNLYPWKALTDTSEHFKIFQILNAYSGGIYTKEEARERFKNVDLSDLNTFREHIKECIKDILKEDKEVKIVKKSRSRNTSVKK